ncbi:hypothetical protein GUJ93_ZPchr0001g32570 [Zizania palustris]|uniref:Uncharacterized protein n=1 Tax=Zizania palustris TaxID=103762 RepID=A0A8J5UZN1_ZIZPA|nr:hypothetical protein GUJ93_ZPchr0001g32570 [Zizania palustris]
MWREREANATLEAADHSWHRRPCAGRNATHPVPLLCVMVVNLNLSCCLSDQVDELSDLRFFEGHLLG